MKKIPSAYEDGSAAAAFIEQTEKRVFISKDLLKKILVFFWQDLESYTGAGIDDYDEDSTIAEIYDGLIEEFSERCEELYPGEFQFSDDPDD